ncbi:MAG: trypsin-like peptidase domain-containing protein [Eubacteriales bacterium]|nr:trypsin-like peptidase domain-containing protein [Eubacteriales bacterium]
MDNNEKFYRPSHPQGSRSTNTYNTQNHNGVYCVDGDEHRSADNKKSKRSALQQVLTVILIVVALISVITLRFENKSLNERLDKEIKAQADTSALLEASREMRQPEKKTASEKHMSVYSAAVKEDSERETLSITEIAKTGKPSVVAISTEKAVPFGYYFEAVMPVAGSGFFISEDGLIATNNHVVEGANNIKVHTDDGYLYEAQIVGNDPVSDLAVIKIEPQNGETFPAVIWGDSDDLEVGELAVAIGNPSGTLEGSVTAGIISALERTIEIGDLELNVLQTDAAINAGNSGGALFNSYGEVIGINTAKLSGDGNTNFDGIAFAIPSNYATSILEDLSQHGKVTSRVLLGITGRGFDTDFARRYRLADRPGILISSVLKGSSADKAGLAAGDFLVEIDGQATDSIATVNNMKKYWTIDQEVDVVYFRNGEKAETKMILQGEDSADTDANEAEAPTETEESKVS